MKSPKIDLHQETEVRWRIARQGAMRVPGIVFATRQLLPSLADDRSLEQVANVATLPGIVVASFAMPDVHWGYGFPIGGVAATDVDAGGVVSPGGVGFDISCGVRLLMSELTIDEMSSRVRPLMDALETGIPRGMGPGGVWHLDGPNELDDVLTRGSVAAVDAGYGTQDDLDHCEDRGIVGDADPSLVSERALERGARQVGSLGSGNHFLEVQVVDRVIDQRVSEAFGLRLGQVCVMIHCGSRGLGHQICSDHVKVMERAMANYDIQVPDDQLACVPVRSPEGARYLSAMAAAANYGRANRQVLTAATRRIFASVAGAGELRLLFDVSHNLAKLERHQVDGHTRLLCVHRKGATLALPPGHPDVPEPLRRVGQPVLVPGSMGTASYVLVGEEGSAAFHSACHGAGRTMSRHAALRRIRGHALRDELETAGIVVRAQSLRGLAEEAPFAYKDVDEVVTTCETAGLARRVVRLRPIGVIKG